MASSAFNWDEEKARERRIVERRERVEERLRLQRAKQAGGGSSSVQPAEQAAPARGTEQAACSAAAVAELYAAAAAQVEAVRAGAEQRTEAHRDACDTEEAALREAVAEEAEASRRENRAIDLEWEQLQAVAAPQELHAGILAVNAHCGRVLEAKDGTLAAARALLARRDEQYTKLLQLQSEETDALIATMHEVAERCRAGQEAELEAAEAAYLQERAELMAAHKAELEALLEKRGALEQEFMEAYLAACEAYENELERLRGEGVAEHAVLKRKLEGEVAALEAHLDGIKAAYALNADKLDYNYRVLVEREKESKDALAQQKRKITRQWEVLNRLKKRYAALDARAAADNSRLSDEYQAVTRAFNQLQSKFRHFKAVDLARFEQVRAMKEEELGELLDQLLQAEHFISSFVTGLPTDSQAAGTSSSTCGSRAAGEGRCRNGPHARAESSSCEEEAGSGLGLELVGRAVTVDPLAAAAAAAAFGPGQEPGEVVALPAGDATGLIPAFHPSGHDGQQGAHVGSGATGQREAGQVETDADAAIGNIEPLAWQELSTSADSGALSLLLAGPGTGGQVQAAKLQQLLAQVPPGTDGRLGADAVARSLGLQQQATVAALQQLFAGAYTAAEQAACASPSAALAASIQPRLPAGEGTSAADTAGSSSTGAGSSAGEQETFSLEQVEHGMARLLCLLAPGLGRKSSASARAMAGKQADGHGSTASSLSVPDGPQPTSKQYWQARADAVREPGVARAWALLERQASQQFAMLQGRTATADEVLALRQENEWLKASLAEALNSPVNKQLRLPPTLLLR